MRISIEVIYMMQNKIFAMCRTGEDAIRVCMLCLLVMLLPAAVSVNAEVLLSDSFNRADSTDIDSGAPVGMGGPVSPIEYVETGDEFGGNVGLTNLENNQLHLADGPNMTVMYPDHNFVDSTITDNGGMRIGITIVSNDGTATDMNRFVGFGVGNTKQECDDAYFDYNGVGFRGRVDNWAGTSDIWIGWSPLNGGTLQVFKNGPTSEGGYNYDIASGLALSGNDRLELELTISDFNAGTTVVAGIYWNSILLHTTNYQWDHSDSNYIGFSTRQNDQGFTVDDFEVIAVTPDEIPFLTSFTASPDIVDESQVTQVTLTWNASMVGVGLSYAVTADKTVEFLTGADTGTAVNGQTSVTANVDGALGDVQFTVSLYDGEQLIDSLKAMVGVISKPDPNAPNVIVILLDDTGWSDIGCYGSEIKTPNIDSLAAGGVRFRDFYQAARCAPTRISILSGLYTQQGAVDPAQSLPNLKDHGHPNANNVTIAEVLAEDGYRTYMSGKWHLGTKSNNRDPVSRGFMHVFGQGTNADGANTSNAFGYWLENQYNLISTDNEIPKRQYGSEGIQFHYSDAVGDYSVDFIEHHINKGDDRPFFLYMPFNAAHWPVCAPAVLANKYTDVGDSNPGDEDVCLYEQGWDVIRQQRYERQLAMGVIDSRFGLSPKGDHPVPATSIPDWNTLDSTRKMDLARRMAVYAAMLDQVDMNIGKVIDKLKAENIFENTLIFFCCDNGANYEGGLFGNTTDPSGLVWNPEHLDSMGQPENSENTGYPRVNQGGGWANMSNTPFRLFKHFTHDGGIRTPAILHWPAKTAPEIVGTWTEERGHLIDVMSTVVAATGAKYPLQYAGHSVFPMEGTSLLPVLQGDKLPGRDVGVEHENNRALFRGNYKFTTKNFSFSDGTSPANELELYDLSKDGTEMNNLAQSEPNLLNEMISAWNAWATRVGVPSDRLLTVPTTDLNLPDPNYPNAFFQDLFSRDNNVDIDADSGGMSGILSPVTYVESFEGSNSSDSIQVVNNRLQMATGSGMSSMYLDHNFIDDSILTQGGFTVILDVLEINGGDDSDRFGGFGIGLNEAQAANSGDILGHTITLRPKVGGDGADAVCDFYIDLSKDGILRAWNGNNLISETTVIYTSGRIRVDFLLQDFASENRVIARIYFNDEVKDIVLFNWDYTDQNYIGISARATSYVQMDNLVIMPFEGFEIMGADLTGDGDVDLEDFSIVASQWFKGYTVPCPSGDYNGDCYVNMKDLAALISQWLN